MIFRLLGKTGELFSGAIISYFVAFLLDHFFFQGWREVKQASTVVSIDRPGPGWDILSYCLISAIVVVFFLGFIHRRSIKQPHPARKLIKILAISTLVAVTVLSLSKSLLVVRVDTKMEISGRANDQNQYYYLFVRPTTSGRCWLQEPIPLKPGHNGKWWAGAYFGGIQGQRFELIAIASSSRLDPEPFSKSGSYACSEIPNNIERFVRTVKLN